MIRINLLSVKRKKKPAQVPLFVVLAVLLLTVSGIGIAYGHYYLADKAKQYTARRAQNQQRLDELEQKIQEVKNFEENNKDFERKKGIIERLGKSQNAPVILLNEIGVRLTDGIWLETLDESNWQIKVVGKSFSNAEIVNYIDSLKNSKLFNNVVLVETKKEGGTDTPLYSFSLTLDFAF
jgi:Tfp pilus assembly protein PilN